MIELLPTLIAVNVTVLNIGSAGDTEPIELDFGAGDGARIMGIEFMETNSGDTGTYAWGVSTNPNAAAPASFAALAINPDVIGMESYELTLVTEGGSMSGGRFMDLSNEVIIVTRGLRCIGFGSGVTTVGAFCRVHYNQVKFTADELRAITIVNR